MKFDEMVDLNPYLIVADFLKLCLMADDKIYIDIDIFDGPYIENLRVIDSRLIPFYEYKIIGIYEAERIVLVIRPSIILWVNAHRTKDFRCSNCGCKCYPFDIDFGDYNYCPNCGRYMGDPQEKEGE